jgi:hypothetical protein
MEEKIQNIRTLLELNGGKKATENTAISIIDSIKHLIPDFKMNNVKPEDLKDIVERIQEETIPIYDKYFSNEEILGFIDFYKTPIGQVYLSKMGTVAMESMKVGSKYGEIVYKRLLEISGTKPVVEEDGFTI